MCTKFEIDAYKFDKVMDMYLKIIKTGYICSVSGVGAWSVRYNIIYIQGIRYCEQLST